MVLFKAHRTGTGFRRLEVIRNFGPAEIGKTELRDGGSFFFRRSAFGRQYRRSGKEQCKGSQANENFSHSGPPVAAANLLRRRDLLQTVSALAAADRSAAPR